MALKASDKNNVEPPKRTFCNLILGMMRTMVLCIIEKRAKYLARPDCGEDTLDEDVGSGSSQLISGKRVDDTTFFSW